MAGIDIRMDGCWRMVLGTGALGVASVNLLTCLMSRHMGGWMGMRGAPRHGFEQRVANNGGAK